MITDNNIKLKEWNRKFNFVNYYYGYEFFLNTEEFSSYVSIIFTNKKIPNNFWNLYHIKFFD